MAADPGFKRLENSVASITIDGNNLHDRFVLATLKEALAAVAEGNFGVGAVLVNDDEVIGSSHNQLFKPYFRSDLHAEMALITEVENNLRGSYAVHRGSILYTSLEPCAMCFMRVINAGIGKVYFAAEDSEGSLRIIEQSLPRAWAKLMHGNATEVAEAPCSENLKQLSRDIVAFSIEKFETWLAERRGQN